MFTEEEKELLIEAIDITVSKIDVPKIPAEHKAQAREYLEKFLTLSKKVSELKESK